MADKMYNFMELSDDPDVKKKVADHKKTDFDKKNPPKKIEAFKKKFAEHLAKEKTKKQSSTGGRTGLKHGGAAKRGRGCEIK